ncbi:hypothetical protein HY837_03910 [archaeon]|nr:hypothetical protein [archaeon]
MKIEEYLRALKECPEGKVMVGEQEMDLISVEYGVYDNWPILVNTDYKSFVDVLVKSGKYKLRERRQESPEKENCILDYVPGVITLLVRNYVHPFNTTGFGFSSDLVEVKHSEKQLRNNKITIMLHPYQKKTTDQYRIMAEVIIDLADYFMQNKISFCFPKSTDRVHTNNLEKIVYYEVE